MTPCKQPALGNKTEAGLGASRCGLCYPGGKPGSFPSIHFLSGHDGSGTTNCPPPPEVSLQGSPVDVPNGPIGRRLGAPAGDPF